MRRRKTREKNSNILHSYVGVVYQSAKNYSHWQRTTSLGKININRRIHCDKYLFIIHLLLPVFFLVDALCGTKKRKKKLEIWQNALVTTKREKNTNGAMFTSIDILAAAPATYLDHCVFFNSTFNVLYLPCVAIIFTRSYVQLKVYF